MRARLVVVGWLSAALAAAACSSTSNSGGAGGTGGHDAGNDAGTDGAIDAPAASTLSGAVQPLFTASCAVTGCHTSASPVAGLDLTAGHAYAATVNVASTEMPSLKLVSPGDAANSYLYDKITGTGIVAGTSVQPPPTTGTVLSTEQKNLVRDWINAGAPND